MNYTSEDILLISVPLTSKDRQIAQSFADEQQSVESRNKVYRNTLAVLATHRYLEMVGIPSELESSHSWDRSVREKQDVADLYIPEIEARIECRAINSGDKQCYIPKAVWEKRAGYIVVEIDNNGRQGIVQGFIREVSVEQIPRSYLQPLDPFFERIEQGVVDVDKLASDTNFGDWLQGLFRGVWQPSKSLPAGGVSFCNPVLMRSSQATQTQSYIDQLYASQRHNIPPLPADTVPESVLAHLIQYVQEEEARFQAAELLWEIDPDNPAGGVRRSLDLSLYIEGHTLGLLAAILVRTDERRSLLFQIYPTGDARFIPQGLQLIGLDENGESFFEVIAREQDDRISLKFLADEGDRFSLRVVLNNASMTENFIV